MVSAAGKKSPVFGSPVAWMEGEEAEPAGKVREPLVLRLPLASRVRAAEAALGC
jgi:hypothetical protein